ncbi:MAG: mannose-1-phosphate guanylyltransferase, partial [Brevundimonas sp.]|nr:mannose-1-phosphate guanylyltransferase [Brevundimonas sp.]
WNSGAFIATARTLREELERHAPDIWRAVAGAVPADGGLLAEGFRTARRLSFDYAVMEKTDRASVLPLTLAWSDLGAWDAVATVSDGEGTAHLALDSAGCLIRAPDGVTVATLGVSGLAVIVERDAVLVCDLSRAQDVKRLLTRE